MNPEEQEWVEQALCDAERARCVRKILSIDRKDVVAKGDNYTSELSRLKMKVILHSGEIEDRAVIYKVLPSTEMRRKAIVETGLFIIERRMYTEVLPFMEKIRREFESSEPLWGQCYAAKGYESILLEDLQVHGYKMGERRKGLDFPHCCLVMKALAKFHALGAVLIERGQLIIQDFQKNFVERNRPMMEIFYKQSFDSLIASIEQHFEPERKYFAEKLRRVSKTLVDDLVNNFAIDSNNFNTLNHGDCWVNNMMFRYDEAGNPIAIRLIDFQVVFYNNVGHDLQYFLSTSPETEIRARVPELLEVYQQALSDCLTKYRFAGKVPTLDDVKGYFRKAGLYGMTNAISLLPLMKIASTDVPDMEEWIKKYEQNQNIDIKPGSFVDVSKMEEYTTAIKLILDEAEQMGVL